MRAEVFFSRRKKHERGNLMMKSLSEVLNVPLDTRTKADRRRSLSRERKWPKRRKTDAGGLPWTFWCSMRWQSHMNKSKMPGWRWCFSIPNMMERQSEVRIWHRQRSSNLLTVAVLNKCQSENAASLFKSIRGLGLTVSGGRSPLLWGWGDFFSLPKFSQSSWLQATFARHNNKRTWQLKTRFKRLPRQCKTQYDRNNNNCNNNNNNNNKSHVHMYLYISVLLLYNRNNYTNRPTAFPDFFKLMTLLCGNWYSFPPTAHKSVNLLMRVSSWNRSEPRQ